MARDEPRDAAFWIARLGLAPHPEGGHFRETYRAADTISTAALPARFRASGPAARACSTAVYYLLAGAEISALHRLRSDEVWHHYAGSPLVVSMIDDDGGLSTVTLGADPARGERFQGVAPAGVWFGAALAEGAPPGAFALIGCTVAPGFDFADFELAGRAELLRRHPQHRRVIERLTR
jgi:predicted cupin superfamily sugar epimerase